ncbi:site-specific integrase [Xenorhabdus bovienii]|uniref:Site-specific integrase n=1 Tax=Xenorhabdus bovienii TaxID=40576 RepID=A0AAJ1JF59_XENBV|nr:site-specific integrase [Xenorhabdus bovienii]MDE1480093.1 site-specific integrase [Xenorhabdus bovienii]MDE1491740.1 site-specific integrase [Xenorhabdus bovienii]MDE9511789.1 site-specific integrase [Xenorhabdus bovienii]MDE9523438.1 site-specific integrase [Xenorhabdus bovienii]
MNELIISDNVTSIADVKNNTKIPNNPALSYLLRLRSKKSQKTMRSCLTTVVNMFGEKEPLNFNWSSMNRDAVQVVLQRLMSEKKSPNSINLVLCAIKGVAEEARTSRIIDSDTYHDVKSIKRVRGFRVGRGRMLEQDEIKQIFQYVDFCSTAIAIRDAAMISLMIGCGLRRSEVADLEYSNIDFKSYSIKICGKGNKERENFMPEDTYNRLKVWVETVRGDHSGALFTRIRKNDDVTCDKITTNGIGFVIEQIIINLGMKSFTPHDFRRTYASLLLENGEDILTVKEALGHASVITTQKYDKRSTKRLKEAARKLQF